MVTLITQPGRVARPKETGVQRAARRLQAKMVANGSVPPTKETRQNHRYFGRKALRNLKP